MKIDFYVLTISTILNLILSSFVFLRNPHSKANKAFGLFGASIILWTTCNFLADNVSSNNLLFTRLTLLFGACVIFMIFLLSLYFPKPLSVSLKTKLFIYGFFVFTILLCMTDFFVASVTKTPIGVNLTVGSLYTLYTLYMLLVIAWALFNFWWQHKRGRVIEKNHIKLFSLGVVVYIGFAMISNVVLPVLVDDWSTSRLGPIFTVPFVGITAYAIMKHGLFDIKSAVARTVGYVLTISFVAVLYAAAIIFFSAQFGAFSHPTGSEFLLLVLPAIFIGLTFHRIEQVIASLTRRIFYRDAYDLKETLDKLSDALVTENAIGPLMSQSLHIISQAIKPANAYFMVLHDSSNVYREIMVGRNAPPQVEWFIEHIPLHKTAIVMKDELETGAWFNHLSREGVSLVLRLGTQSNLIGFLMFGPKQNGSVYTKQDVDLLQISAKNLGIALDNARKYEQISDFANTLHHEVTKATTNLREANEELKSLDALKDDFISMASHQLRTPATSVHQALQMLNHPSTTTKDRDELIEMAEASSERLVTVVANMLSVARLQAGHFTIDRSPSVLQELVKKVVMQTKVLADQKDIVLKVKLPNAPINLAVDVAKLNEAMSNYIENAIKYSGKGTTVTVRLDLKDNQVAFEVLDNGMGVPENEQSKLFGKFYRAQNARHEQPDGNGIGLFVVRSIAQGHEGDTYYKPLKQGSLFGFWLPLSVND
ncbi:MAG: hypothetical protein JWL85_575 [Candidatus Saccharibacteria bacterium]|nr:hypothetical protein [Candidatus Saccharibacteria bacterium]